MTFEYDSTDQTITVDDVKISLELLRNLANPDISKLYQMIRIGDTVTVTVYDAKEYLDSILACK